MRVPSSSLARRLWLYSVISFTGLLGGCSFSDRQSVFDVAGPVSKTQYDVQNITLFVSLGIFLVVGSLLVYAAIRFRGPVDPPADAPLPPQTHGNPMLEAGLTLAALLLVVIMAIPTVRGIFRTYAAPQSEDAVVVNVTGYQWWWAFEYPDSKVVTANELRIPLGRPVILNLKAADVIHSFWVPKLAGKTDLIPNQHNQMWLEATEPGTYYGQCAEYCGTSHANMRFRVVTMYDQEFNAWLAQQKMAAATPTDPLARDGMDVFMKGPRVGQACATCHTIQGTPAMGLVGPNLTHFASRGTLGSGLLENNDQNVAQWLTALDATKPGNKMLLAHLSLSPEEVRALAAYLRTLR